LTFNDNWKLIFEIIDFFRIRTILEQKEKEKKRSKRISFLTCLTWPTSLISAVASAVLDEYDERSFLFDLKPVIDSKLFNSDDKLTSN